MLLLLRCYICYKSEKSKQKYKQFKKASNIQQCILANVFYSLTSAQKFVSDLSEGSAVLYFDAEYFFMTLANYLTMVKRKLLYQRKSTRQLEWSHAVSPKSLSLTECVCRLKHTSSLQSCNCQERCRTSSNMPGSFLPGFIQISSQLQLSQLVCEENCYFMNLMVFFFFFFTQSSLNSLESRSFPAEKSLCCLK